MYQRSIYRMVISLILLTVVTMLEDNVILENVLFKPDFHCHLLYAFKLTMDFNCSTNIYPKIMIF